MRRLRGGYLWMIRRFGLRRTLRYERQRRAGVEIDYARAFSPDELAVISEHFDPAPWEQP